MKDSGIEWIGQIPQDWETCKLKYIAFIDAKKLSENTDPDYTFEYIDISSVTDTGVIGETTELTFDKAPSRARMIVNEGDIIVSTVRTYLKAIAYIEFSDKYIASTGFCVISPHDILNKYLYYQIQSEYFIQTIVCYSVGVSYPAISSNKIGNIKLLLPPSIEQQRIADNLDKKCAEIDSVIKAKEKTNELLKEVRQSIIYEAVTKGLDKNAPMKDSGIEWIGQIPQGWEVKKLRYIFAFNSGISITRAQLMDEGIPCINYGEIHSRYGFDLDISRDELKCVDFDFLEKNGSAIVKENDFVFCDTSEDIEGCGNCVYISNTNNQKILAGSHTIVAKPQIAINSRYLAYLFGTAAWRAQIRSVVSGIKVFSITQSILKTTKAIIPPTQTQNSICDYLDKKCGEIDSVINANNTIIQKLKEYKQSIIYEAVTGKTEI